MPYITIFSYFFFFSNTYTQKIKQIKELIRFALIRLPHDRTDHFRDLDGVRLPGLRDNIQLTRRL